MASSLFPNRNSQANHPSTGYNGNTRPNAPPAEDNGLLRRFQAFAQGITPQEAEKRLNSTGDAVKQAEEDYFIAREKYRAGEGLMLDIIDAQEALSTARLNYISAEYDYARYKATVENAMGIGLTDGEKEAAAKMTATAVPAEQVERAVLQEPVVPENAKARVDKETKGLAKKADKKKAAAAAASDASAEVIHDLAEGEITK